MKNNDEIKISILMARALLLFLVAPLMLAGIAMGEIPTNGLVAEWHFDGDAKDSSGNGIGGTGYGTTFADGKFGKALALNGGTSYADFGEGGGKLDFGTGPFSIEFWMNYQGTTVHPNVTDIMGKTPGNANTPGYFAWTTTWGGDGSNYGLFIATSTASWGGGNAEHWGAYLPNTWYHIVFVRNGNTWTIYKNGENVRSETKTGMGLSVDNNENFKIGESTSSPNFKGLIDEVRIYNRALGPAEIKANYESGQIIITVSPSGAEVLVDGQSKGNASPGLTAYGIAPGSHVVKCKLSGYLDYDTNVALTSGSVASINCALNPAPTPSPTPSPTPTPTPTPSPTPTQTNLTASNLGAQSSATTAQTSTATTKSASITGKILDAKTDEPLQGATILIDGRSAATDSNGEYELTIDIGKHNLSVNKQGYETLTRSIIVPDGGTMLDLSLKSTSSDSSWLWMVFILLIVVVAVVIIYLLYKRKKKEKVEVKKEEKKVERAVEKKKFCMFCHAPMPEDAEFCPKCGKKQDETKRFCMSCGALMPSVPEICGKCKMNPPSGDDTKNCRNCGEVIPVVAKFCSACGAGQPE